MTPGIRWLDLGCGHRILPEWRAEQEQAMVKTAKQIVGLDPDLRSLEKHRSVKHRVQGDAGKLPFADAVFDLVTANMVVEHLESPEAQLAEVRRILKPGGRFLFHTPNVRAYTTRLARAVPESMKSSLALMLDGREADDVFPAHYRANTAERIADLAARAGLECEWIEPTTTLPAFAVLPPVATFELLWIRLLEMPRFSRWRQTLIVSLRRAQAG